MYLKKVENLVISQNLLNNTYKIYENSFDGSFLGTYTTKERALEVLDEINNLLDIKVNINASYEQADITLKGQILCNMSKVYTMPLE